MTWTNVCFLPFDKYKQDFAIDVSGFNNDARISGKIINDADFVTFQSPKDQLIIQIKDDSLQRFIGFRIEASIKPQAKMGVGTSVLLPHRYNIVEGWMSFAFFIEQNGQLVGGIYNGQDWIAVTSGNSLVPLDQWSDVSFEYDGICIGKLQINGKRVGININMPMGMRQPYQNITIGHWPSGDDRYTFIGDVGKIIIYRRDYEDFMRDTLYILFCRRRFGPQQADALMELMAIARAMDNDTQEEIDKCAKAMMVKLIGFFRALRASNMDNIEDQTKLGKDLKEAWCCAFEAEKAKRILMEFFRKQAGTPKSEQRAQFIIWLKEFNDIMLMCERKGPIFDRIRELLFIIFPEFQCFKIGVKELIQMI
jgi:hypothetical protein